MAKNNYTVRCFFDYPDGRSVPFEELSEDEVRRIKEKMSENLSRNLSRYYQTRPEEFERLREVTS